MKCIDVNPITITASCPHLVELGTFYTERRAIRSNETVVVDASVVLVGFRR